ncbi:MAG: Radical SAM domain protein [Parcubacteria group bacterium GW2011_GWC2_38_7]|nr:MAG: Radical SAM domain protein [Parcubacteria group bacterium GW2011_GWC2_38_7]
MITIDDLPMEFDLLARGYVMRGWSFSRYELADAINAGKMLNPTFEGMTNFCPWNCDYCYTERESSAEAHKQRLATELPLERRLEIIHEAAALGAKSMNFIGAGEPTLDQNFWELVECVAHAGMIPIVFSEASFRLTDRAFVQRLYELDATVVIKVNSLWNAEYQNALVAGNQPVRSEYFGRRNQAIALCQELGFADEVPTRLGFDTIITQGNYTEIPRLHQYARENNIFIVLKNFLHTGRAKELRPDAVNHEDQTKLWKRLAKIDRDKFGIKHASCFPFGGGTPCCLRSTGVHISVTGQVFRCDGEEVSLGDLRVESLSTVWHRIRQQDQNVAGLCPPRECTFQK